jgi:MscS family membrane protein
MWMRTFRYFLVAGLAWLCLCSIPSRLSGQAIIEELRHFEALPPVQTHSPADTLNSLNGLHDALIEAYDQYHREKTKTNVSRLVLIQDALISLLDLSQETSAERRNTSIRTALALIDIVDVIDPEEMAALPGRVDGLQSLEDYYAVPGTPLLLQRVSEGPREGEFLFSANTSAIAPRFLREIAIQSPEHVDELWSTRLLHVSGPMIPSVTASELPEFLTEIYLGTPLWKIVLTFLCTAIALGGLFGLNALLRRRKADGQPRRNILRLLLSATTLAVVFSLNAFFEDQLFLTGSFARFETLLATLAIYSALAWTFWCFMIVLSDFNAKRRSASGKYYDESVARLMNHIIAIVGVVWILAYGAQTLGFPLLSILAGLGIGGLAVALAIRPTLENLISGIVLYLEKSVKVGDYCSFSGQAGTVESIGIRSTHIRALDRTLIAIPNSKFVDMELVNWARCDEMLINSVIGLRYETDTEQLRYVLVSIREMMLGHPRINNDTIRVRLVGYESSSLDIEVRVYAKTREWNDFFAIKEDVLFRIKEIVEASGTGFAFPSQTVYVSHDQGLDDAKTKSSIGKVREWRRARELPFPNFSKSRRENIEDSLRYPPPGSPEFNGPDSELPSEEEPLSSADRGSELETKDGDLETGPKPEDDQR